MTDSEVKPLFSPGLIMTLGGEAQFVCNIGGELSLWRVHNKLRVYFEHANGIWLYDDEALDAEALDAESLDAVVEELGVRVRDGVNAVARHADTLRVYMQMLR
jgi:hypothetical protein